MNHQSKRNGWNYLTSLLCYFCQIFIIPFWALHLTGVDSIDIVIARVTGTDVQPGAALCFVRATSARACFPDEVNRLGKQLTPVKWRARFYLILSYLFLR
jgi:hypothetical protein